MAQLCIQNILHTFPVQHVSLRFVNLIVAPIKYRYRHGNRISTQHCI